MRKCNKLSIKEKLLFYEMTFVESSNIYCNICILKFFMNNVSACEKYGKKERVSKKTL